MSNTVFLFPIRLGNGKIIEKKISRLLHKKLVLWRPFPFFDLIFMSSHDFNFRLTYTFLFAIFQEACRIMKKSKDGGLRFSDEKLMSWRSNFDFPCRLQLFEENVLFEFIPNIQCDCTANKFTSSQNFDARNQLNPIRIGVPPAFNSTERVAAFKELESRGQFLKISKPSRQISLSTRHGYFGGVFGFRRWCHGCV